MSALKFLGLLILTILIGGFIATTFFNNSTNVPEAKASEVTVYKTATCGCCGNYVSYLKRQGFKVNVVDIENMEEIKQKYAISADMSSCHTTVIGDQFVEGHIPVEAIRKMMTEAKSIKGIALPDMPSGSPGMPGDKKETWEIKQLESNGNWTEFMNY